MKRFAAGALALGTALSLSVTPATAQYINNHGVSKPHMGSAKTSSESTNSDPGSAVSHVKTYNSSYKNDFVNGYPLGTTADILWGFAIAGVAVAALVPVLASAGVLPPQIANLVQLPR